MIASALVRADHERRMTEHTDRAHAWFSALQTRIAAEFERLEDEAPADLYPGQPGRFELKPWVREAGGGGTMGFLRGRFFEKCGLHVEAWCFALKQLTALH